MKQSVSLFYAIIHTTIHFFSISLLTDILLSIYLKNKNQDSLFIKNETDINEIFY